MVLDGLDGDESHVVLGWRTHVTRHAVLAYI